MSGCVPPALFLRNNLYGSFGVDLGETAGFQAGEAGPVSVTLVMDGEERIATVHGRAADGVLNKVGVDVDASVLEE